MVLNRNTLTFALCLTLIVAVPLCMYSDIPAPPESQWVTPERGWVCLDGECRRPSDAHGFLHPNATRPDSAYLFTFARQDGSVDYFATPSRALCETARGQFVDVSPSGCGLAK